MKFLIFFLRPLGEESTLLRYYICEMPIRTATTSDCERLQVLMDQLGYPATAEFFPETLSYLIKHPDYYVLVFEHEVKVVGFIVLHIVFELGVNGNTGLITYLVVDESVRSQRIGEQLEREVTVLARRRNCVRMQLHCSSHRTRAHQFYERMGYQRNPEYFSKAL